MAGRAFASNQIKTFTVTTTKKLLLGFGTLTALLVVFTIALTVRLKTIENNVRQQVESAAPRADEARQIEMNAVSFALTVRLFSQTGDTDFRKQAGEYADNVDRHIAEYARLGTTDAHRVQDSGSAERWGRLKQLGLAFLAEPRRQTGPDDLDRLKSSHDEFHQFLEQAIQLQPDDSTESGPLSTLGEIQAITYLSLVLLAAFILIAAVTGTMVGSSVVRTETKRRKIESALLQSEESFSRQSHIFDVTLSSITDFAYTFDINGRFTYVNQALLDLWGMELHEAAGKTFFELDYPHELAARLDRQIKDVFNSGQPLRDETSYTGAAGIEAYYEYIFNPVFGGDGKIELVAGSTRDISLRKRAEDEVRRLAAKNLEILESFTDGFFAVDRDWRFTYLNCQAEILLERNDLIGTVIWEEFPALAGTEFEMTYRQAAAERESSSVTAYYTEQGRWYEVHAYPAETGITSYFRNVTENKKAEVALRSSEERYRTLFNSIDEAFCVIEVLFEEDGKPCDYRFIEVNPSFEKVTGLRGAPGRTMREMVPDHEQEWFDIYGRIAMTGEPARFKNAAEVPGRWYDVYAFRIGDDNSRYVAVLFNDITERELAEGRSSLLAGISEMIRTTEDPDELLYAVSVATGKHYSAKRCFFNEIDMVNDTETVHRDYCDGAESMAGVHLMSDYSPITLGEVRAGKTVINFDSIIDPRTADYYKKTYEPAGERSYVAVPLMRNGAWAASLWMSDDKPRKWNDGDVAVIETIAERSWLAVERLRSEMALKESEERFAKAFNSSPLAVTITSLKNGKLVEVNDTFVNMSGFSRDEAVGRTTIELGLWEKDEDRDRELSRVVGEGRLRDAEYRFRMRDGSSVVGLLSAELLELNGEPCSLTVIQNITERKAAEEALRESEEKFRIFSDTAPALIWFNDAEGQCRYVNRRYLDFSGKSNSDVQGFGWGPLLHPDESEGYISDFTAAQRERRAFRHRARIRRHDGAWRWIESFAQPLFGSDGNFLGHVGVSPDITDSVEAEEVQNRHQADLEDQVLARTAELETANQSLEAESLKRLATEKERVRLLKQIVTTQEDERRRIARDLHDELGQQLTALRLKLGTAKIICDDEKMCDEIDQIQSIAARLDQEVSFLARELRPAALEGTGLTQALSAYIKEWAHMSSIVAEFHSSGLNGEKLDIEVETNLYRIAQEALNNVRKHSQAKNVSVLLEKRRNEVTLIIEDDGIAFDPEAKRSRNSGLGLIGMHERVALLGGKIEIESAPGIGSTVFAKIPYLQAESAEL